MKSLFDTTARDERPDTQQLLEESRERMRAPVPREERRVEVAAALAFVVLGGVVAFVSHHQHALRPASLALVILVAVAASRAALPVGAGFTTPMALADVPALFLLPPAAVGPAIALSYLISRGLDARAGRLAPNRIWLGVTHATPALGAALVFALAAPGGPDLADWPIYLAAIAAQVLFDI